MRLCIILTAFFASFPHGIPGIPRVGVFFATFPVGHDGNSSMKRGIRKAILGIDVHKCLCDLATTRQRVCLKWDKRSEVGTQLIVSGTDQDQPRFHVGGVEPRKRSWFYSTKLSVPLHNILHTNTPQRELLMFVLTCYHHRFRFRRLI